MHPALSLIPGGGKGRAAPLEGRERVGGGPLARALGSRPRLAGLLGVVFLLNLLETNAETWLRNTAWGEWTARLGGHLSEASSRWEWGLDFAHHAAAGQELSHGYSISYFVIFPLLCLGVAVALAARRRISGFRTYCVALALDYALCLPFFLFFPVVERWAWSSSGAILLSDKVSTRLIDWIRPMSGLDNCFPSFHVSMTVITILVAFAFRMRLRYSILCLGLTVVLSTLVLGIHWQADVVAGVAVACLSYAGARRLDLRLAASDAEPVAPAVPAVRRFASIAGGLAKKKPLKPIELPPATNQRIAEARDGGKKLIFVSYRRDDAADLTDHLCARIAERFKQCVVFKDVDAIPPGANFKEYITAKLHQCDVLLAVIGKEWLVRQEAGGESRLHDPQDLVRLEIEVALEREIPLIPVLVHGASMPTHDELPPELADLGYQNAIQVRRAPDFYADVEKLGDAVEYYLSGRRASGRSGVHVLPPAAQRPADDRREERRERLASESRG